MHNTHTFSASAGSSFQHYRETDFPGCVYGIRIVRNRSVAPRHDWNPSLYGCLASFNFVSHKLDIFNRRSDKGNFARLADIGETGVLRQKTVSGMNGVAIGYFRGGYNRWNIKITFDGFTRADANGLIGESDGQ